MRAHQARSVHTPLACILQQTKAKKGNLRPANGQITTPHPIPPLIPHNAIQMQHHRPQSSIIRIRQIVNILMQSIPPLLFTLNLRRFNKTLIPLHRQQGIRQIAEKLLEKRGDGIYVVEEVGRVAEIYTPAVVVELVLEGCYVAGGAGEAVDSFHVEAEGVDCEDGLDYD